MLPWCDLQNIHIVAVRGHYRCPHSTTANTIKNYRILKQNPWQETLKKNFKCYDTNFVFHYQIDLFEFNNNCRFCVPSENLTWQSRCSKSVLESAELRVIYTINHVKYHQNIHHHIKCTECIVSAMINITFCYTFIGQLILNIVHCMVS